MLGGSKNISAQTPKWGGLKVSTSQFDAPVAIFWGQCRVTTNAIDYVNFQAKKVGGKKSGGGKKGGSATYNYSASVELAMGEGPVDSIVRVFATGSTSST